MAVQIVGKAESLLKEVTCTNCLSILKYAPIDVATVYKRDISGCSDAYNSVTCPCCGSKVSVN